MTSVDLTGPQAMNRSRAAIALLAALLAAALPAAAEGSITGAVRDGEGKPVAGARVVLSEPVEPWREMAANLAGEPVAPVATGRTDAEGRFELAAPAGLWRLEATAPGHRPWRAEVAHDGGALEHAPLDLAPDPGLELTVTDAAGRPIAGARVGRPHGGGGAAWRSATGEDGIARLPRAPQQRRLEAGAVAPGFAPARLEVAAGEVTASLRLVPGEAWTIEVRDRLGRPVPGALISTAGTGLALAATGDDGRAEVRLPVAEEVRLLIDSASGHAAVTVTPPRGAAGRGGSAGGAAGDPGAPGDSAPADSGPADSGPAKSGGVDSGPADSPDHSGPVEPRRIVVSVAPGATLPGRVLAETDRLPLAGAHVWVRSRPDLRATTDARGTFTLPLDPHAPSGTLIVLAAAPGHQQEWQLVEAAAEEAVLVLAPQATVSGRVVDAAGEPVAGARLVATSQAGWTGRRAPAVDRAVSATDGGFRLTRLDPATVHRLLVEHPRFATAELDLAAPPAGGAREDLEVVLDRGARAFGVVFGADGAPLAGATAVLRPVRGSDSPFRPRSVGRDEPSAPSADSDADGLFAIEHVVPGRFDLHVTAAGHAPLKVPGVEVPEPPEDGDLGSVSLQSGAEIAGRVVDSDGKPLAAVEVKATERDMFSWRGDDGVEATTGAGGRFVLRDLAPGTRLDLMLTATGFVLETVPGVVAPPERPLVVELTHTATVAGRVVDGFGAGIARARVEVKDVAADAPRITRGPTSGVATAGEDGRFVVEGATPGTMELVAGADEFQTSEPLVLELTPGERREGLRLVLARGGSLAGRVTGPGGEPVADATILAAPTVQAGSPFQLAPRHQARSDHEGRYRIGGLPPGEVQVRALHPDYAGPVREATIGAGEARLDLELRRGIEVSGRVVDDAGAPVAGVEVSLVADSWLGFRPPVRSGDDGSFRLTGVEPGTWRLAATKDGLAQVEPELRLDIGGPLFDVEVRMTAGGAIVGQVRGLELADLSRLRLFAISQTRGGLPRTGSVDFEGGYRIEGTGPGTWRVMAVSGEGEGMASGEVELAPGQQEARLDLDFAGDLVLSGRVTLGGEPLAGAQVGATGGEPAGFGIAHTAADGGFRIGRLGPGRYELMVSAMAEGLIHREEIELHDDREVRIELEASEVAGRVVDAETGAPVPGAEVRLAPAWAEMLGGSSTRSGDPDGAFRLRRVAAGEYRLRVDKEGYATVSMPLTVGPAGGVDGLEVALTTAAGVLLEVTSASGMPPQRVIVAVLDPAAAAPPPDQLTSGAVAGGTFSPGEAGRVRLAALAPGRWRVLVTAPGAAVTAVELTAPGPPVPVLLAAEAAIDVTVRPLADIAGAARVRLLAADGRPLLVPTMAAGVQAAWPLPFGRVRLTNVPAGAWTVEVTTVDERVRTRPVTAVAGAVVDVVFE
jgi:protocatechuate 3,4-dioxygenase beta subunit